jgi:3-dehydroquinate dehydratase-2
LKIAIINGPNLNLVGIREPSIYGHQTMEEMIGALREKHSDIILDYYQSNHEGSLIDKLHEVGFDYSGIILNAGGYTHTSIALADAVRAIKTPVIELHISDISNREKYRQHSYLKECCIHHIIGRGMQGYAEGLEYFLKFN